MSSKNTRFAIFAVQTAITVLKYIYFHISFMNIVFYIIWDVQQKIKKLYIQCLLRKEAMVNPFFSYTSAVLLRCEGPSSVPSMGYVRFLNDRKGTLEDLLPIYTN